jgi:hypothetical protein
MVQGSHLLLAGGADALGFADGDLSKGWMKAA